MKLLMDYIHFLTTKVNYKVSKNPFVFLNDFINVNDELSFEHEKESFLIRYSMNILEGLDSGEEVYYNLDDEILDLLHDGIMGIEMNELGYNSSRNDLIKSAEKNEIEAKVDLYINVLCNSDDYNILDDLFVECFDKNELHEFFDRIVKSTEKRYYLLAELNPEHFDKFNKIAMVTNDLYSSELIRLYG